MWGMLASHFTTVGMCGNTSLAMFAIDSLKQLSVKFLMKPELSNFNFQAIFLKPFETIVSRSDDDTIKDLILSCIDNMILACAGNIRSGWKTIFAILESTKATSEAHISGLLDVNRLVSNELSSTDLWTSRNSSWQLLGRRHAHLQSRLRSARNLAEGKVDVTLEVQKASDNLNPLPGAPGRRWW